MRSSLSHHFIVENLENYLKDPLFQVEMVIQKAAIASFASEFGMGVNFANKPKYLTKFPNQSQASFSMRLGEALRCSHTLPTTSTTHLCAKLSINPPVAHQIITDFISNGLMTLQGGQYIFGAKQKDLYSFIGNKIKQSMTAYDDAVIKIQNILCQRPKQIRPASPYEDMTLISGEESKIYINQGGRFYSTRYLYSLTATKSMRLISRKFDFGKDEPVIDKILEFLDDKICVPSDTLINHIAVLCNVKLETVRKLLTELSMLRLIITHRLEVNNRDYLFYFTRKVSEPGYIEDVMLPQTRDLLCILMYAKHFSTLRSPEAALQQLAEGQKVGPAYSIKFYRHILTGRGIGQVFPDGAHHSMKLNNPEVGQRAQTILDGGDVTLPCNYLTPIPNRTMGASNFFGDLESKIKTKCVLSGGIKLL